MLLPMRTLLKVLSATPVPKAIVPVEFTKLPVPMFMFPSPIVLDKAPIPMFLDAFKSASSEEF